MKHLVLAEIPVALNFSGRMELIALVSILIRRRTAALFFFTDKDTPCIHCRITFSRNHFKVISNYANHMAPTSIKKNCCYTCFTLSDHYQPLPGCNHYNANRCYICIALSDHYNWIRHYTRFILSNHYIGGYHYNEKLCNFFSANTPCVLNTTFSR